MNTGSPSPSTLRNIFRLLRGIHIPPIYLALPIVLSIGAAAFEGMSLGLLIPILNGFLKQDYSFITDIPGLKQTLTMLPPGFTANDRTLFASLMTVFTSAIILKNTLKYASAVSIGYFTSRSLHHLRKVLFSRYLSFGKLYFDKTSVGHNAVILSQFTESVLIPLYTVNTFVNAILSMGVYLMIMFMISAKLTLFAIPFFTVLFLLLRKFIQEIRHTSQSIARRSGDMGKVAVEILSTIPLVKAYTAEQKEQIRYAEISDRHAWLNFKAIRLKELINPLQETVTLLSSIVLFAVMFYIVLQDQQSPPTYFIVYFYLLLNASSKFGALTSFRGTLANAAGPAEELLNIFEDEGKEFIPNGTTQLKGPVKSIDIRDLTFSYPGRKEVLKHISLSIKEGQMIALVGATGSGKSTLIHLLMRLYDAPAKSIFINDKDIRSYSLESLLSHMALVSQETLLIHDTLRANITYGLENVSEKSLQNALRQARLDEFIAKLPEGMDTLIGDRGVKLSGGERQRVSIARALLKKANVLILDEATSALDSVTEKLIQEAIDEAVEGRTAIVIAHRLSTIQHADRIIVLDKGEVVEQGTLNELQKKKGQFHHLWQEQQFR